jgi:hypothetical protein
MFLNLTTSNWDKLFGFIIKCLCKIITNTVLCIPHNGLLTVTSNEEIMELFTIGGRSEVYVEVRLDTQRTIKQN